jgi:hypothetical protein
LLKAKGLDRHKATKPVKHRASKLAKPRDTKQETSMVNKWATDKATRLAMHPDRFKATTKGMSLDKGKVIAKATPQGSNRATTRDTNKVTRLVVVHRT